MRFISLQKAALAGAAAALALLAADGASFAGQASGAPAGGAARGGGISGGAVVILPGAPRAHGQGRWIGGNGFGGPGQHWESRAHNLLPRGIERGFRFRHADVAGFRRPPAYFGGGVYNGGYFGGNGVYYTDNVLAYSDDSYRPAAYSAIDVYPPVDADYDQVYIAAPTIIEMGAPSSCAPTYKPLQHIYYAPATQFRPMRKNRRCSTDEY